MRGSSGFCREMHPEDCSPQPRSNTPFQSTSSTETPSDMGVIPADRVPLTHVAIQSTPRAQSHHDVRLHWGLPVSSGIQATGRQGVGEANRLTQRHESPTSGGSRWIIGAQRDSTALPRCPPRRQGRNKKASTFQNGRVRCWNLRPRSNDRTEDSRCWMCPCR